MPEEINRVLTDQVADVLYTTERTAEANLLREGVAAERIVFVGNVMIDSLLANRAVAVPPQETLRRARCDPALLGDPPRYGVVTLHRPSNVDHARDAGAAARAAARRVGATAAGHSRCIRAPAPTSSASGSERCSRNRGSRCCRRRAISRCWA